VLSALLPDQIYDLRVQSVTDFGFASFQTQAASSGWQDAQLVTKWTSGIIGRGGFACGGFTSKLTRINPPIA